MNVSPEEARTSLAAVQQTRAQMRKQAGLGTYFPIIWGLVWFFGCLANQFLPLHFVWLVWLPILLVGSALSGMLGYYLTKGFFVPIFPIDQETLETINADDGVPEYTFARSPTLQCNVC